VVAVNVSDILDPPVDVASLPARDRILTAAYRLFYRDGIRATGIDKVIAGAGVTKVTFYRHFASKDALVVAFLDLRHDRWMEWFRDALARHAAAGRRGRPPVVDAIEEWVTADSFRGCAFINSVTELGGDVPQIRDIAARHKADMVAAIRDTLPPGPHRTRSAQALGVAVDGAIVHAQYAGGGASAVKALATIAASLPR